MFHSFIYCQITSILISGIYVWGYLCLLWYSFVQCLSFACTDFTSHCLHYSEKKETKEVFTFMRLSMTHPQQRRAKNLKSQYNILNSISYVSLALLSLYNQRPALNCPVQQPRKKMGFSFLGSLKTYNTCSLSTRAGRPVKL